MLFFINMFFRSVMVALFVSYFVKFVKKKELQLAAGEKGLTWISYVWLMLVSMIFANLHSCLN